MIQPSLLMQRRHVRHTLTVVITLLLVAGCLLAQGDVSEGVNASRVATLNARITNIYTTQYQQMADDTLAAKRDKASHDFDHIFLEANPYGTNTTSLYAYFTTDDPTSVSYTVSAEGYPDFTRTAYQDQQYQTTHEFSVLGLIPQVTNTITFTVTDKQGNTDTRSVTRKGPKLLGVEEIQLERTAIPASSTDLGDGLYAILGNDSNEQDFMFYYDTNGVLRGEIPIMFYRSHRLLFDDNGLMWFSASTHTMVGMNRLGKLEKIYNLGDRFILHHDYAFDQDQNIVLLATDLTREDHAVQDQIIKLDTTTGNVTLLLDSGEMFPEYKNLTEHAGIDESDPTATGRWDWIHYNTIQMLPDGSALLSARETSTIIKIKDLETNPTLDYMIGESSVWDGTDYTDDFLTKVGNFSDTGGQHSITYVSDPSLPAGQYRLYMFDNNYGYASTRPNFDWSVVKGINTGKFDLENVHSQYREYIVDENTGTYTEVNQFDVPASNYVSSAQQLDNGNILIDSGGQGLIGVYNTAGTLLTQYRMKINVSYIYRVYSYDFSGFYFA